MFPEMNYKIRNYKLKVAVHNHAELLVEYAEFILYEDKGRKETIAISNLSVPCRSNLFAFLSEILYAGDQSFQGDIPLEEKDVPLLKIIFQNQRDYSFWREGLKISREQGREKAWEWIREKVPILELRNKLKP